MWWERGTLRAEEQDCSLWLGGAAAGHGKSDSRQGLAVRQHAECRMHAFPSTASPQLPRAQQAPGTGSEVLPAPDRSGASTRRWDS
jgi:hypothetical protein